ncbi:pSer/pThr/pTyr-binding forkhead associated (FHA) protein [Homoserinimonas aerilata]|uniref:PSer/pThr/pTyr-binding forkhead associated (FHA) protein n=1 Tax=Homoserinimonas aerilata TaxID=1162970 RepID=A0A542YHL8_9MICO|nr:pSer/pThr/pTyr-binding forkhead associated (FHA) protein [Homoserinimonas aerilata]
MTDDGFLAPPPGLVPTPRKAEEVKPEPVAEDDFISLPPGLADFDSGTFKVEPPRRERVEREEPPAEPVFFPTPMGLPPVIPVQEEAPAPPVGRRSAPAWRLALPDGSFQLLERTTLIGRDPSASGEWPDAVLLAVTDAAKSVSKTHAALEVDASGGLVLHDLNSTNGSYIAQPDAEEIEVEPGAPQAVQPGAQLGFGEYTVTVQRD